VGQIKAVVVDSSGTVWRLAEDNDWLQPRYPNTASRSRHMSAAPRWLKPVNKLVMVPLLRLGLPISRHESPVVLTVPGRRTGKPRSTPVTPMLVDGTRYLINGYPGADWVHNVRAAREVTLRQGRRTERVRLVELSADAARPALREFPTQVPVGVDLMKRAGVLKTGTADELEGLAGRLPVFRIDPIT
jgi:deazaflavin-dependent oxidoreductase (nitroreductase family)